MREAARSYLILAGFLLASFLFLRFVLPYLIPFVLALFLAEFVEPAVAWLEARWRLPRAFGAAFVILTLVTGTGFFLALGVVRLGAELLAFSASLPDLFASLTNLARSLADVVGEYSAALPPMLKEAIDQQMSLGYQVAQSSVGSLLNAVQGWLAALPQAGVVFLLTALATYFLSRDRAPMRRFVLTVIPAEARPGATEIKARLLTSTVGLIKAQAVLVTITFFVYLGGLAVLGARYALLAALVASLLDLLPVLGPSLLFLPWAAYAFGSGEAALGLGLLVLYGVVALVRGSLQAYVIGERIGLHPLATLVAMYVGVRLFGPAGVVYGPLVAILLKAGVETGLLPPASGRPAR